MNLAWRDIRHNLGRFLLTCVGLSLLLGIVLSMIGIFRGLEFDALALVRAPGADLWVVESGTRGPFAEASRIPGDTREAVARIQGVAAAGGVTYQAVQARYRDSTLRLYAVGFEPGRPGGPSRIAEGRALSRSHFELLADRATRLAPGDRLQLGRNTFTVVGLVEGHLASGGDPVVYMTLRDAQHLQFELEGAAARNQAVRGNGGSQADTINAVVARVIPGIPVEQLAAEVARWKHVVALTEAEQEDLLTRSVVEKARRQIGLFTVLLLVVSTVIIALILYTLTLDKLREIATLKLIGAPDRTITGLITQQALAMGTIGFGVGAVLINLAKDHFPRRVILLPEDGTMLALVVLVVCLLASSLGVRLALKVDPATALGG